MDIHAIEQFLRTRDNSLKGCSQSEVQKLESYFNVRLPDVYKAFLFSMGKDAGQFMRGTSAFYKELFILREDFEDMLSERGISLPDETFVFWSHQGYQFAFFPTNNGDNPPIYFYREGEESIKIIASCLADFFTNELKMSGFVVD
ncbi:SUKH superfamily protein [Chitinophaga polysaccharea]|uniref:SUKH superfamily protein n=1 Tax=Chitinophaga polysaccharea TaxID=1293035 RepID=A0A561Q4V9_9BACT|nr:SMI1/KNR4 family protein [Chitinophaga polysaccharea]TWF45402.1 SUKH superfamily protein [Chitinophaga polysaccharea]